MLSKLPKISKELLITGIVIFVALNFRTVFALTQTSRFVAKHILYLLIAFVPLTILITSKLSGNFKNRFKAIDIAAVIVLVYSLFVVLHDTVVRYSILTAIGTVSVSLLLCTNIFTLPVAAILNFIILFVPELGASSVMSVPAATCFSMVYFSYIFEKKKTASKKKNKKSENTIPVPDYKKEKIIFVISQVIFFAALAVMVYYRKNTVALITFMSNIKYIIPILIPAIFFVIFAVQTIKNKKPFIGVIGYIVAVAAMPLTQLCEYSVAAGGTLTAFLLLLMLCDPKLDSGHLVEKTYEKIAYKASDNKNAATE